MKTPKKVMRLERRGSALPLVLSVLVILLTIGTGLLGLGLHSQLFTVRTASDIIARCAADAGLTKALFELNEILAVKPWDDSTLPEATDQTLPNCDATFSYTVTGDIGSGFTIESIGKSGHAERRVYSTLRLQGLFEYAVFGEQDIGLKNSATIDWYNYDADDKNLQVGTNSTELGAVDLKNGATVNGDVVVGADGDPDVVIDGTWATITGETYAMTEVQDLPLVAVPGWLESVPSGGTIEDNTTISSSGKYDEIDLENGKILTIDGPVTLYITGDVTLKNSAEVQVVDADGVSLTLYLAGDAEVKNSGAVNNQTEDPKKVKIYGLDSCESIILKNGSDFYGTIYARNADVVMMNSGDAFGAIVAKSFEQKNSATLNYDASLREVNANDEGVRFVINKWSEE
jgi:hypothetical protein